MAYARVRIITGKDERIIENYDLKSKNIEQEAKQIINELNKDHICKASLIEIIS